MTPNVNANPRIATPVTITIGDERDAEDTAASETSCDGKHRFAAYWQADGVAACMRARDRQRGRPARVVAYRCPRCDGFHVGTFAVKRVPLVTPPRWRWPASYDGGTDTDAGRDEGQG